MNSFLSHISEDKYFLLESPSRYAGFLLTPAEVFGLQIILIEPSANACVCPFGKQTCKEYLVLQGEQWVHSGLPGMSMNILIF